MNIRAVGVEPLRTLDAAGRRKVAVNNRSILFQKKEPG
jgi:hypothetical protein